MPFLCFRRRRHRPTSPASAAPARLPALVAGRRHLIQVPYALPKDLDEANRLDFQHYLYRQVLRGNFLVPLNYPRTILDVGAGTGIWGKELARHFPHAQVYGLDLEEVKSSARVPTNYHFVPGNVLEGLPFAEHTFEFTHQRLLLAPAIPLARWGEVLRELLRVTTPGGWVELVEVGVEGRHLGPLTQQFFAWGITASQARGLDLRQVPALDQLLREAGGRNVGGQRFEVPLGQWEGRLGRLMGQNLVGALAGLKALYLEQGSEEEFHALLEQLSGEWAALHSALSLFVFWCQK